MKELGKIKILFISDSYSGIDPWLIEGKEPSGLPPFYKILRKFIEVAMVYLLYPSGRKSPILVGENIKIFRLYKPQSKSIILKFLERTFQMCQVLVVGAIICLIYKPQIIYVTGYMTVPASLLGKVFGIKVISRVYGTFLYQKLVQKSLRNFISAFPEILVFKSPVDAFIITNDGTKGDMVTKLLHVPSKKVYFWINGIDKNLLKTLKAKAHQIKREILGELNIPDNTLIVSSVGRLASWKRIDLVIKVYSEMINKKPLIDSKLIIIGSGKEMDRLKLLCQDLNLDTKVFFIGQTSHVKALEYIVASDILLFFYEHSNVGNVLLESLYLGKVIIARNTGDTSSFIKHGFTGLLVPDKPEEAFISLASEYLFDLLHNSSKRNELSRNATLFAESEIWDWDIRIYKELELIKKILELTINNLDNKKCHE